MKCSQIKRVLLLIVSIFCVVYSLCLTNAGNLTAEEISIKIKDYIETKADITEQFPLYNFIRVKISQMVDTLDETQISQKQFLHDLAFYNNNNILELVEYITSREGSTQRFFSWKREGIEQLKKETEEAINKYNLEKNINYISMQNEYISGQDIYQVSLVNAEFISEEETSYYGDLEGKIFFRGDVGYIFVGDVSIERKIPFAEIIQEGPEKFLLYSDNFFEKDRILYTYSYSTYFPITGTYGIYKSQIESAGYNYEQAVFLRLQDAKNNITFDAIPQKISNRSSFGVISDNEQKFINESVVDILRIDKDYSQSYKKIQTTAILLTKGMNNDEEKIQAIYDRMTQNIIYPEVYELEDYTIFSGLEAINTQIAICEGQARLMYYLLKSAGVKDVYLTNGYVIDSLNFPRVGHAWIQVGDYFYDPSFETHYREKSSDYLYYKMPYDLAYTNRYNLRDMPEGLLNTDKKIIQASIDENRYNLTFKYGPNTGYKILESAHFRKKYNLHHTGKITLNDIFNSIGKRDVDISADISIINGLYLIENLDEDMLFFLEEVNYDIDKLTLIQVYDDGKLEGYYIDM